MTGDTTFYRSNAAEIPSGWNLWWRRFRIRLASWEYWPVYIFNIPILGIWLVNALRARDLSFSP